MTPRAEFAPMRHILEIPMGDDRYWPRIPGSEADALMLDLEDSVTEDQKDDARVRCCRVLADANITDGKRIFVRVNAMSTPWAEADLRAMGTTPPGVMICMPKVESRVDVVRAAELTAAGGSARRFYVMIESYSGLLALEEILSHPQVIGVHFGYTDYGFDVRCRIFSESGDDLQADAMTGPRAQIAAAAARRGLFATGGSLVPDFRDLDRVERFVRSWRDNGYTACIALSPSHLAPVARGIRPGEAELKRTHALISGAAEGSFLDRKLARLTLHQAECS